MTDRNPSATFFILHHERSNMLTDTPDEAWHTISVRVRAPLKAKVELAARTLGISESRLGAEAIADKLTGLSKDPSFRDQARQVAGKHGDALAGLLKGS